MHLHRLLHSAAECHCFPRHTVPPVSAEPITGPQAHHVLACSETDVERYVCRVASHFCQKHLLYCVLSCSLLFPQTRKKPRFWEPSLILFT